MTPSPALRQPCPPGVCNCKREQLLGASETDLRILKLTRLAEKELLERLENVQTLSQLEHLQRRMYDQLGIQVSIEPGFNEVRSARGIDIQLAEQPGLCRKTRKDIPTAIRRAMTKHPEIAYKLLDEYDLLRGT